MRLNRLEWRLPAAIAGLLLLVSGTLAALTVSESRRSAVASAQARLEHLVSLLGSNFETNANAVRQSGAQLAKEPEVVAVLSGAAPAEPLRKRFAASLASNAMTYGVELWNVAGDAVVIATAESAPEVDP